MSSAIDAELRARPMLATDRFGEELGASPEAIRLASGVLAVRIEGNHSLTALWIRPEQVEEVSWAGDPREKEELAQRSQPLTPRRSFATWREIVLGRSSPWTWEDKASVQSLKTRAKFILQRHRLQFVNEQLAEANAHLNTLATTDPLTGLPNRRMFDDRLRAEWSRCDRSRRPLAVVAIDVDNFKKYNDRFGHPAGDECLKQVASALKSACRAADVAARVGAEEFALLLSDLDATGARAAAERVRLVVEQLGIVHPLNGGGIVTISLGLAEGPPEDWGDTPSFLKAADEALYEAKAAGRNCLVKRLSGAVR